MTHCRVMDVLIAPDLITLKNVLTSSYTGIKKPSSACELMLVRAFSLYSTTWQPLSCSPVLQHKKSDLMIMNKGH